MSTLDSPTGNTPTYGGGASYWPVARKYGLLAALVMIALGLVFHLAGMIDYAENKMFSLPNIINYAVLIAFLVLAMKKHRDEDLGGYISYGRCVGIGFGMGVFIGIVTAIWAFLFFSFIEPGLIDIIREKAEEGMLEQGMDEEQLEMAMKWTRSFTSPVAMAIFSIVFSIIQSVIFSLIIGIFMSKKRDEPQMA